MVADGTNSEDGESRQGKKTGVRIGECGEWRCMKNGMERLSFGHTDETKQTVNAWRGTLTVTVLDLVVFRVPLAWLINTSFSFNGAGAFKHTLYLGHLQLFHEEDPRDC